MYNNQEGYQIRMVSWKFEDHNGIRKQPYDEEPLRMMIRKVGARICE
jgi:hypothetical protein